MIEDLEDLKKVVSTLERMVESDDTEIRCRLLMVESSVKRLEGDFTGAIEHLDTVNDLLDQSDMESDSLNRLHCVALNNKALLQCELDPSDIDAALMNIDRAILEAPDSLLPSIYDSMSTVLKKRGDCNLSIEALAKAADLSRNTDQKTGFNVSLVELMYECGNVEKAVANSKVLQQYIYSNPRPDMSRIERLELLINKGDSR